MLDGKYILDVDGHVTPDRDVDWNKWMPADIAAEVHAVLNRKIDTMTTARTVTPELAAQGFKNVRDPYPRNIGGYDPKVRLGHMDLDGIDQALLFPTIVASPGTPYPHPLETIEGYHRWLSAYCATSPERLKGVTNVPLIQDLSLATQVMRDCVTKLDFVAVITRVHMYGRTLSNPVYTELFTTAQDLDIPIMVHLGSRVREWMMEELKYSFTEAFGFGHPASSMIGLMDILYGGWLEKLKTSRFGLLEGDVSWLPFWLGRLDNRYEKIPHHAPLLKKKPSEYFAEHRIFITGEGDEPDLAHALNTFAEDICMYSSDYPHWDATFPGSTREIIDRTDITETQKRKMLGENARALVFGKKAAQAALR